MTETMGSLCDKLTIVKLKQWHTKETEHSRLSDLARQAADLQGEIDEFLAVALQHEGSLDSLTCRSNKVYDLGDLVLERVAGSMGELFAELAQANCELWHEQEKVYEVQRNPASQTDAVSVLQRLGHLNLRRTACIDAIDDRLVAVLTERTAPEQV